MRLALILFSCWMACGALLFSAGVAMGQATVPPPVTQVVNPQSGNPGVADALFLLPGDFTEQTTLADLQTRFGAVNLQVAETTDDAGVVSRSAVLFPNDPTRRAYVRFYSSEWSHGLADISVRDTGSRWRGKHGARIGMSLAELRELNGKPFYLSGFDDKNLGSARDQWSPSFDDADTVLGKLDVEEGDHMYFGVEFGLRSDVEAVPAGAFPRDATLSSDDPRYPGLGDLFKVTEISAYTSLDDEW